MKKRANLILKIFVTKNFNFITIKEFIKQVFNILRYQSFYFIEKKINNKFNENVIYYLIRRTPPGAGFFSNFHLTLAHLDYALQNKYKPIIDYENYSNFIYGKKNTKGFKNYWDDYFIQPNKEKLIDIKKNFPYILSQENILTKPGIRIQNTESYEFLNNEKLINRYSELFTENIYFKKNALEFFESTYRNIFENKKNVLGASIRGTDYVNKRPSHHYIQPTLEEFIFQIDSLKDRWNAEHIFLSTEDEKYRSELEGYYGKQIFYFNRKIYDPSLTPIHEGDNDYESHLFYICEIYLLSRCDFLVGAPNGGFSAAVIFNANKYKKKYIFNLGKYP
jgi:hypothetical protein